MKLQFELIILEVEAPDFKWVHLEWWHSLANYATFTKKIG